MLVALSKHLAPAFLRIGGTDQNTFSYNMSDKGLFNFSLDTPSA
jgi:hypothetical protein